MYHSVSTGIYSNTPDTVTITHFDQTSNFTCA